MQLTEVIDKSLENQKIWLKLKYPDLPTKTIAELAGMMVSLAAYAHRKGYVDALKDVEAANGQDKTD